MEVEVEDKLGQEKLEEAKVDLEMISCLVRSPKEGSLRRKQQ